MEVEKKKKVKAKPYDIDESKKIFLYAYECQLKNEKVDWKKAEEMKLTKHSGSSMRSHYQTSIKNEISLYMEMYPEEVSKLFDKVKKHKKEEKKKQALTLSMNLSKQRSNMSLNRITRMNTFNFNKSNSLNFDKLFSTSKKNQKKHPLISNIKKEEQVKKKKKLNDSVRNQEIQEAKENNVQNNEIQSKDPVIKKKKISKNQDKKKKKKKKKEKEKSMVLRSTIEKTNKTITSSIPKVVEPDHIEEKNEKELPGKKNKIEKKEAPIGVVPTEQTKREKYNDDNAITKENKELDHLHELNKEYQSIEDMYDDENEMLTKELESKLEKDKEKGNYINNTTVHCNSEKPKDDKKENKQEENKASFTSFFGYIFKKIFH